VGAGRLSKPPKNGVPLREIEAFGAASHHQSPYLSTVLALNHANHHGLYESNTLRLSQAIERIDRFFT
jgi:hypothetical protein